MNGPHDNFKDQHSSTDPRCEVKTEQFEVFACYPHDATAFTEGLQVYGGVLYESTGLRGKSSLRRVELKTGKVLSSVAVKDYFAEGITILGGKIFQLTYTEQVCLVYDLKTLRKIQEFTYEGEGWGLTNDGQNLIMSDKTNQLHFIKPETFEVIGRPISVYLDGNPLRRLNELEYINGSIYANVFPRSFIVRINPRDGAVLDRIDLSALKRPKDGPLNGIAFDEVSGHLLITGKNWDTLFEISLTL